MRYLYVMQIEKYVIKQGIRPIEIKKLPYNQMSL